MNHLTTIIIEICFVTLFAFLVNGKSIMKEIKGRTSIDVLYSNEEDSDLIEIDQAQQEKKLREAALNCSSKMAAYLTNRTDTCFITWDQILCWPETQINQSVYIPCPTYVNKFNRRYKASKHCVFNRNTSRPGWTKTNFSECLLPSQHLIEELGEKKIMEKHLNNIIPIKLISYVISLFSLIFSIYILSRPRLRCPRNYVHINLFVTFCFRVFSVIFVNYLRFYDSTTFGMQPQGSNITQYLSANDSDGKFNLCRFSMTIFRYSASVYSVAITTEAFYLMLLLKFPYYSEKKGSKFCIIISWVLPFLWILPWLVIRVYIENKWCWQMESIWNLLIDAPNTILTIVNVLCAIFVIQTLYSKIIKQSVSPEKVIKYRRLAKSILIIIPIFGVHFIIFEWLPYFRVATEDSLLELPLVYMEIIFNGLQGLLASIACCFVQKEAQIETLILLYNLLKRFKALNNFKCLKILDQNYIQNLKYSREFRSKSFYDNSRIKRSDSALDSVTDVFLSRPKIEIKRVNSRRRSSVINYEWSNRFCCCLFSNQKNDFYQNGHRRSTLLSLTEHTTLAKNFKRLRNSSSLTSFFNKKTISEKSFKTIGHKFTSQPEPVSRLNSMNSEDLSRNLINGEKNETNHSDPKIAINNLVINEEERISKDSDSLKKSSSTKKFDSESESPRRKISFSLEK